MFSKNIRHQRRRELIKNQQFIQLISMTMKVIPGSNYGTESSLLWEITVFCHWLQRSSLYSENTCYVTLANRIFGAKYVVAQNMLLRHYWFSCRHIKIVQSQTLFTAKVSEHAILQISVTLENTVSPANFNHWSPTGLKGINHSSRTRITIREYIKKVSHPDGKIQWKNIFKHLLWSTRINYIYGYYYYFLFVTQEFAVVQRVVNKNYVTDY